MPVTTVTYPFEGTVTQFLPGKRVCFVTLSSPIGSIKRAILHAGIADPRNSHELQIKLGDTVRGELVLMNAEIGEITKVT